MNQMRCSNIFINIFVYILRYTCNDFYHQVDMPIRMPYFGKITVLRANICKQGHRQSQQAGLRCH